MTAQSSLLSIGDVPAPTPDFSAAFNSAPHLYVLLTPALTIVGVSDVYCAATGFERAALIGRSFFEIFPDDSDDARGKGRRNLRASLARTLESGRPDTVQIRGMETTLPESKGGGIVRHDWTLISKPILAATGAVTGILLCAEDVTEKIRLQEENRIRLEHLRGHEQTIEQLRSSGDFLDAVIEDLPGILFVKSYPDFRFLAVNRAWEESRGHTRDEVLGKTDFDFYPQDEAETFLTRDRATLEAGTTQVIAEEKLTTRNKGVRYFKTTKVSVKDRDGKPLYLLGFSEDITDRKAIEEQLRQAVKMEAVGQLTGGIAHDFNNLLGVVIANIDFVAEDSKLDASLRTCLEDALQGALRGAELTRRLLNFSRKQPLHASLVDLNASVVNSLTMLRRTLGGGVLLEAEPAENLWSVRLDPGQIEEAILNLALNARDAMPNGGTLNIRTANIQLDQDFVQVNPGSKTGDHVMLTVADSGAGMTPETIKRCFEPFFTTKSAERGTGLGLSMVYGFVKQSSGFIKVESAPGSGTTIRLFFPRADGETRTETEAVPQSRLPTTDHEMILVVDDNDDLRRITVRQLNDFGYRPIEADSGLAALAILGQRPDIKLLFADVIMPGGMTGVELAQRARQLYPELRVLLTSGFTGEAITSTAEEDLPFPLLAKPYRREDLAQGIHRALTAR